MKITLDMEKKLGAIGGICFAIHSLQLSSEDFEVNVVTESPEEKLAIENHMKSINDPSYNGDNDATEIK
jgi:hypothetical protein